MVKRILILLFCLLLGTALSTAAAQRFQVFTEELPPVHYTDGNEITGIATDIVRALFQRAGLEMEIHSYPWKRTYQRALHTDNGFVYTINRTSEREPLFQWIGPILAKRTYLYKARIREDVQVRELADLKKYRTAVILGYALTSRLKNSGLRPGQELVVCRNKEEQLRAFLHGRADLITGNEFTLPVALRQAGHSMCELQPALLMNSRGYYLAANLHVDPQVVQRLRTANAELQRTGLVDAIIDRYMNRIQSIVGR